MINLSLSDPVRPPLLPPQGLQRRLLRARVERGLQGAEGGQVQDDLGLRTRQLNRFPGKVSERKSGGYLPISQCTYFGRSLESGSLYIGALPIFVLYAEINASAWLDS